MKLHEKAKNVLLELKKFPHETPFLLKLFSIIWLVGIKKNIEKKQICLLCSEFKPIYQHSKV